MPNPTRLIRRLSAARRRGSILILVVALVVLLALIGTAYLSTTQVDRYTSAQNTVNTEADLQLQGVVATVTGTVTSGTYGNTSTGTTYRPPSQDMPTYDGSGQYNPDGTKSTTAITAGNPGFAAPTGYHSADARATDRFLADRVPTLDQASGQASWGNVALPPFIDSNQAFTFGAPVYPDTSNGGGNSTPTLTALPAAYKPFVHIYPYPVQVGGQSAPGAVVYLSGVPAGYTGTAYPQGAGYLTPTGFVSGAAPTAATFSTPATLNPLLNLAGDADGDGVADSVLFPLPGGPVGGITYYGAYRVTDGNSAVNASSAYTAAYDYKASDGTTLPNFGLFRSNVGLLEMFNPYVAANPSAEISKLNTFRYGDGFATYPVKPYAYNPATSVIEADGDFGWYSIGDVLDNQLARRPGNPGYTDTAGNQFKWAGVGETAALAHRFTLQDAGSGGSTLEHDLYYDLTATGEDGNAGDANIPTSPYPSTVAGVNAWYNNQFAFDAGSYVLGGTYLQLNYMPLRSLLVGTNAVADAVPLRLGTSSGIPFAYTAGTATNHQIYHYGDWVYEGGRSYVCILPYDAFVNTAAEPGPTGINPPATPFWAGTTLVAPTAAQIAAKVGNPGLPFTVQPVKTPVNTAPFEQLYLAYAQVMTDSVGSDAAIAGGPTPQATVVPQWQPPMQPVATVADPLGKAAYPYPEQQMPMFRSVVRDPSGGTARRLTSSQMLKLRAALAAVNTIDLRDGDDDVTSRRVILTDASNPPVPAFDVEVFGGEAQPFIGAVYAHVDTTAPASNFITIQFVNPYDHPITVNPSTTAGINPGWQLGVVNRSTLAATSVTTALTMSPANTILGFNLPFVVPAKSPLTGKPGIAVIQSATVPPAGYTALPPTVYTATPVAGSVTVTTMAGLENVFKAAADGGLPGELYLMKPRLQSGPSKRLNTAAPYASINTVTPAAKFAETYDETTNIADEVPVDQVDLTNLPTLATGGGGTAGDFYYRRGTDPTVLTGVAGWNFVYPGPYVPPNPNGTTVVTYATQFPQGFARSVAAPAAGNYPQMNVWYGYDSTHVTPPVAPGGSPTASAVTLPDYLGADEPLVPTFQTFPIVWNNTYMAGPNRLTPTNGSGTTPAPQPSPPQYPFGGFARSGDMMQVPFIGAYRVRTIAADGTAVAGEFQEMNSASEDSSLAEDVVDPTKTYGNGLPGTLPVTAAIPNVPAATGTLVSDPPKAKPTDTPVSALTEQIGRFCPVGGPATGPAAMPTAVATFDFLEPTGTNNAVTHWHYHWAKRLFDYLTVESPSEDYFPNIDPTPADAGITSTLGGSTPALAKYDPIANTPTGVGNTTPAVVNAYTAGTGEDRVGTEGLININTAPWPVLATLPWVPLTTNVIDYTTTGGAVAPAGGTVPDRIDIAKAIVDDRNANGPFKSIADLSRVQAIRLENDALLATSTTSTGTPPVTTYTYTPPTAAQGVFSPGGLNDGSLATPPATPPPNGRPQYDFQDRFILLNRVSNLITTRSDTFTCYVLVQGYRNVGVPGVTPTLAVQRRAAYLLDRNGVTPGNRQPSVYPVSTH